MKPIERLPSAAALRTDGPPEPTVGVLALQGAFRAHRELLERLGAPVREVRRPDHLDGVDALVIPGGESTTMSMSLDRSGLRAPLSERLDAGMPALGTCAGAILLAGEVLDGREDQRGFGLLDITVRRNGFGRQLASFEADLDVDRRCGASPTTGESDADGPTDGSTGPPGPYRAVFIRAPRIERVGPGVKVAARLGEEPVAVLQGAVWATTFHPELTDDLRLHRAWLETVRRRAPMLG